MSHTDIDRNSEKNWSFSEFCPFANKTHQEKKKKKTKIKKWSGIEKIPHNKKIKLWEKLNNLDIEHIIEYATRLDFEERTKEL